MARKRKSGAAETVLAVVMVVVIIVGIVGAAWMFSPADPDAERERDPRDPSTDGRGSGQGSAGGFWGFLNSMTVDAEDRDPDTVYFLGVKLWKKPNRKE